MLLSSNGEAVNIKSLEKEMNQRLYEFSYKPTIDVRSVTQTAEVWTCATCTQCKFEFSKRGDFRCFFNIFKPFVCELVCTK